MGPPSRSAQRARPVRSVHRDAAFVLVVRRLRWGRFGHQYRPLRRARVRKRVGHRPASAGNLSGAAIVTVSSIPAAPSKLTATAVSRSQVNLTWTDNSSNETGFTIQRSSNSGATWAQIATVGQNVTAYSDNTVAKKKTYEYRVAATNSAGTSAWSNVATVTTPNNIVALIQASPGGPSVAGSMVPEHSQAIPSKTPSTIQMGARYAASRQAPR